MSLFALLLVCGAGPLAADAPENLDFRQRTLAGWEVHGQAFFLATAPVRGAGIRAGVSSSDRKGRKGTGLLRKEFVVPAGAGQIRFEAYAVRAGADATWQGDARLDVLLAAAGKRIIPKQVRTRGGWGPARYLLPPLDGKAREYSWDVTAYRGRKVQIILGDDDPRPGSHIFCTGFRILPGQEQQTQEFTRLMIGLSDKHHLAPPLRYESRHFVALSNAEVQFSRDRLRNCELIYHVFYEHFRARGFEPWEPSTKLMVAIFDSDKGFDAYLGGKFSPYIRGLYHPMTNRLVIFDWAGGAAFQVWKRQALAKGKQYAGRIDLRLYQDTVERYAREFRAESNIDVTMHETAHQLSFNCGMLNRHGDVPMWLAEGLACYCEASDQGAWKGIGAPNRNRQADLARGLAKNSLIPLRELLSSDRFVYPKTSKEERMLGYAQSWALFRMLMEQQPKALRKYLEMIYDRQAPEHRLTDFRQCFGADLARFEKRYRDYVAKQVRDYQLSLPAKR